jgi:hypothetical protein
MLPNACPKPEFKKKLRVSSPKSPRRLKKVNPKRKKRLFQEDFGGKEYLAYIHSLPCAICEAPCEYTEAAHVRSRGAGGKASDLVPLCGNRIYATTGLSRDVGVVGCHQLFDERKSDARSHEMRLRSLAKKLYSSWLDSQSAGSKRADA